MAEQYEQVRIKKSVKDFLAFNKDKTGVAMSTYIEQAVNEKKQREKPTKTNSKQRKSLEDKYNKAYF